MSILGSKNNSVNLGSSSSFHEFRKQASFFFKEKIKTARLALTDVTPAQLLTEEATNGNPGGPDASTLKRISKAAFEVDDYWRIVEILHKRLERFDGNNWRPSYKAVIVLDYLLTHGPESVAEEFQADRHVVEEMANFQLIDNKGFNWGLNVRKKSEKVLKLLNGKDLLKEEKERARKLSRGIEGFGSFSQRGPRGILQESSLVKYKRSISEFYDHENVEDQLSSISQEEASTKPRPEKALQKIHEENQNSENSTKKKLENSNAWDSFGETQMAENIGIETSFKENMAPKGDSGFTEELDEWNGTGESKPLLGDQQTDSWVGISVEEDHPFNDEGYQTTKSLLSTTDQALEAF